MSTNSFALFCLLTTVLLITRAAGGGFSAHLRRSVHLDVVIYPH